MHTCTRTNMHAHVHTSAQNRRHLKAVGHVCLTKVVNLEHPQNYKPPSTWNKCSPPPTYSHSFFINVTVQTLRQWTPRFGGEALFLLGGLLWLLWALLSVCSLPFPRGEGGSCPCSSAVPIQFPVLVLKGVIVPWVLICHHRLLL